MRRGRRGRGRARGRRGSKLSEKRVSETSETVQDSFLYFVFALLAPEVNRWKFKDLTCLR